MGGYYTITHLTSEEAWDVLHAHFDEPVDYTLNWLFLSTSGVHGSSQTLADRAYEQTKPVADLMRDWEGSRGWEDITFLIVKPRMVQMLYGEVRVETDEQADWLRNVVARSVHGVMLSQDGNLFLGGE